MRAAHLFSMACCKVCCGCKECDEGEEGKCCCGSECCAPDTYCCNAECVEACSEGQEGDCKCGPYCCAQDEYCCDNQCVPVCDEGDGGCLCGASCCPADQFCCDGVCQEGPCCDDTPVTHVFTGGSGPGRECDPQVKETATITIPASVPVPFDATVSWSADDDVEVDGTRLNVTFGSAGGCFYGDYCCASSGSGTMTFSSRSITVKLIDTVGVGWSGSVTIAPICPP